MKKLLSVVLALVLCLSFAACGEEGGINEASGKYIIGGVKLGMTAEQIEEHRKENDSADVYINEFSADKAVYGHTVLRESVSWAVFAEYLGEDFGEDRYSVLYHMDENLYSVQISLFPPSQSELEDWFYAIVAKYVDLMGEEYEIEEYADSGIRVTFKNDDVKVMIDAWQGSTKAVYVYVTSPNRDHPTT